VIFGHSLLTVHFEREEGENTEFGPFFLQRVCTSRLNLTARQIQSTALDLFIFLGISRE
jgi:hypothetical protein